MKSGGPPLKPMVYPSGFAFATAAVPTVRAPPGLFTTTRGCFRYFSASLHMRRIARSVGPPGGTGTINVTGLLGNLETSSWQYPCDDRRSTRAKPDAITAADSFIDLSFSDDDCSWAFAAAPPCMHSVRSPRGKLL